MIFKLFSTDLQNCNPQRIPTIRYIVEGETGKLYM